MHQDAQNANLFFLLMALMTRSRCVMLGVAWTPLAILRSESLSHKGWPRKGCGAARAPDRRTIWILIAPGENDDSQSARPTSSRCQGGPHRIKMASTYSGVV